ncbi:MAG: Crp/Fnr family transcriptional regulator [Sphingomonadaceae bacterium]
MGHPMTIHPTMLQAVVDHDTTARCAACSLSPICLDDKPADLNACLSSRRLHLQRGEELFHMHDKVRDHLFFVRSGYLKLYQVNADGVQRIIEFPTTDDWLGLDALAQHQQHACAVALTDCVIDALPYDRLAMRLADQPRSADLFGHILGREIARQQNLAQMLRCATAAQRVAQFLLRMTRAPGANQSAAPLPMSRQDIGDYLGLTPATVSRVLSAFRRHGWLINRQRAISLLKPEEIRRIADGVPLPE